MNTYTVQSSPRGLPVFEVGLSNGTRYLTSMAKGVTLDEAKAYFLSPSVAQSDSWPSGHIPIYVLQAVPEYTTPMNANDWEVFEKEGVYFRSCVEEFEGVNKLMFQYWSPLAGKWFSPFVPYSSYKSGQHAADIHLQSVKAYSEEKHITVKTPLGDFGIPISKVRDWSRNSHAAVWREGTTQATNSYLQEKLALISGATMLGFLKAKGIVVNTQHHSYNRNHAEHYFTQWLLGKAVRLFDAVEKLNA